MAAQTILILGESGSGKSSSLRNLNPEETFIISTTAKPLPWRGYKKQYTKLDTKNLSGNYFQSSDSSQIIKILKFIDVKMPKIKTIIIDDVQYIMGFEFLSRSLERGFDKFNEIAQHFVDILRYAEHLRDDLKIIFTSHCDNVGDAVNPKYSMKTVGKLVNEKITPEGLFTYVFFATVSKEGDDKIIYKFLTNSDGEHVAKTPIGMFNDLYIDNDMNEIIKVIDAYNNGD